MDIKTKNANFYYYLSVVIEEIENLQIKYHQIEKNLGQLEFLKTKIEGFLSKEL